MEMTNQEIVKSYNQNPSLNQLNVIAQLNDCSKDEIIAILRKENIIVPKKKARKTTAKTVDFPSKEKILNDEAEKLNIKVLPEAETSPLKPVPKYLIPNCVFDLANKRIDEIREEFIVLCDKIDALNFEKKELELFLKGEISDGTKDELFRKV